MVEIMSGLLASSLYFWLRIELKSIVKNPTSSALLLDIFSKFFLPDLSFAVEEP